MKCSKCGYLGFETGDRCKNCGYDFSLAPSPVSASVDPDVAMPLNTVRAAGKTPTDVWMQDLNPAPHEPAADVSLHPVERRAAEEPSLPLFLADDGDDTPLIALPARLRPPLAVRRTPQTPKFRVVTPARAIEPALDFRDGLADVPPAGEPAAAPARVLGAVTERVAGRRVGAAALDHALLLAIDATVVYFTLQMAGLSASEWRVIPPIPLGVFLVLMKLAYFASFTAVGGQTIGKMAAGIRVVADDMGTVHAPSALRRTLAGALAPLSLGLAYLPALLGADRRALHDRFAHTRVVARLSA